MAITYVNPRVRRVAELTSIRLREVLDYDLVTGLFRWRFDGRKTVAGRVAGCESNGYRVIGIDGRRYKACRLAVFWLTGEWPPHHVNHRNGSTTTDRSSNLRPATSQQNQANAKRPKNNTSGHKGVRVVSSTGRFQAFICVDRKQRCLGTYDTVETAAIAYNNAAVLAFGEYARVNQI